MQEIWKDIKGYEGYYQISNLGNVKSCERFVLYPNKKPTLKKENILTPKKGASDSRYYSVCLSVNGNKEYRMIHRLVAETFIPNPNNHPQINHKDENIYNNKAENLEWCTASYNINYGKRTEKQIVTSRVTRSKYKVAQYDGNGRLLSIWISANEIERQMNFCARQIASLCKEKKLTPYKGYYWKYLTDFSDLDISKCIW